MKKMVNLIIAAIFFTSATIALAGNPHTIYGRVVTAEGSVPLDGNLSFKAYIQTRPDQVLTGESTGCDYESGWFQVGIGNFSSDWQPGEIMVIEFKLRGSDQSATVTHTLTTTDPEDLGEIVLKMRN